MLRWYSRIVGVGLALLGLAGLLGIQAMESFDIGDKLLFVATSPILLYASQRSMSPEQIRSVLGGLGIIYGAFGAFAILASFALGAYSETRELIGDLVHIAVGVVCFCGALFLPCDEEEPPGAR